MKYRKRMTKAVFGLGLASVLCMASGGILYARPQTSVTNQISTGIIDIELEDYAVLPDLVLPGMELPGVKEVQNEGNACYVRAKITFPESAIPMDGSIWMSEGWIYHGDGYWYYPKILETGDVIPLMEGMTIPLDYPQKTEGGQIVLDVDVDAIQSLHFTPDFSADAPWGNVEIERCLHEDGYDISTFRPADDQSFSVTYEGNADALFAAPEDFFSDLPILLPGDTYTDTAALKNNSDDPIILYFWSEAKSSKLLDAIRLTCSLDGTVFYDGPLSGNFQEQVTIPAGKASSLTYTVSVPETLQNEYTILQDQVKWIFTLDKIRQPGGETSQEPTSFWQKFTSPKTGVSDGLGLALILTGASSGCLAILLKRKISESSDDC